MFIISHTKISRTMKSTPSRGGRASQAINSNEVVQRRGASASDAIQIHDESDDMTNTLFCYPGEAPLPLLKEFDKIMGNNVVRVLDLGCDDQNEVSSSPPFPPLGGGEDSNLPERYGQCQEREITHRLGC